MVSGEARVQEAPSLSLLSESTGSAIAKARQWWQERLQRGNPVERGRENLALLRSVGWPDQHVGRGENATVLLDRNTLYATEVGQKSAALLVVCAPAGATELGRVWRRALDYLSRNTGVTLMVRIEGVCSPEMLEQLLRVCPKLRSLDLSDCHASVSLDLVDRLKRFNQLHELNLNLEGLSRAELAPVLLDLAADVASPLVTLRLFGCQELDLDAGELHAPLFALPQLRELQFHQVSTPRPRIGTRWAVERFVWSDGTPGPSNRSLLLYHAQRPRALAVRPNDPNQIMLPY